jgi:hypothetical protein
MQRPLFALVAAASLVVLVRCDSTDSSTTPVDGGFTYDGGSFDGGSGGVDAAPVNTCAPVTGPGTTHKDTISADETWKAADGPHVVTFGIKVAKGATLTIEPCAEVRIQKQYAIVVEGALVANGTPSNPISFVPDDPSMPWGYLQVFAPGTMSLAYATVSGGGGETTNSFGMIEARGDQTLPAQKILKLDHVTLTDSAAFGVSLRAGGAFTDDSQAVTITKSKSAAMRILPRLAGNVPTGTYTGNADDSIVVETEAYGEVNYEDVTFHDRGVPYKIGGDKTFGDLRVGPSHFTLTLEAGVKFAFKKGGALRAVDSGTTTGVLVANGTATSPVVFTSVEAAPAAGDWLGIQIGKVADAFKLDHVEIRYAGGPSLSSGHHCQPNSTSQSTNDDAALAIYHEPGGEYLTNSLVADSAGDGVDNAYTGTYVDAKATNTFTNVAGCSVTRPLPTVGSCQNLPCP